MVKIIKKGIAIPKTVAWYKLKCKKCGCEYYVTEDEFDDLTDPNYIPILGTICCPNEECPMNKKTVTYALHDALVLPEGEEPKGEGDE